MLNIKWSPKVLYNVCLTVSLWTCKMINLNLFKQKLSTKTQQLAYVSVPLTEVLSWRLDRPDLGELKAAICFKLSSSYLQFWFITCTCYHYPPPCLLWWKQSNVKGAPVYVTHMKSRIWRSDHVPPSIRAFIQLWKRAPPTLVYLRGLSERPRSTGPKDRRCGRQQDDAPWGGYVMAHSDAPHLSFVFSSSSVI
jgi:hypothetical protein